MNISDLKNIDVKNINLQEIQNTLQTRQDIAANIALVLGALFLIFQIISGKQSEAQTLKSRAETLEKKIGIINLQKQAQHELNDFVQSLPQGISGSIIVDKLTDFAEKRGVQIIYVSPTQTEDKKFYDRISLTMSVVSKTYKDLWLFIYDIETSANNLRVDKWTAYMDSNRRSILTGKTSDQKIDEKINAQIEIGSINFKK